jgi:patatin-like phospholipase/acyl hydrolase
MGKTIKILSIDGGGTRGLMPATMLNSLELETGKSVTEMFDVIVGAATGGIIATALAAGVSTSEIIDIYLNRASYILPGNAFRRIWNPVNLFSSKYPNKNLKSLLIEKFGADTTMTDVYSQHGNSTIFLIATLDLSPDLGQEETPAFKVVIYNSILRAHHPENLVDIAMRSSAAAVNLPIYQHFGEGGNYANDPALIGFSFSLCDKTGPADSSLLPGGKLGLAADISDIRLLSLGCGSDGRSFVTREKIGNGSWGLTKWMGHLVNLVIDTGMVYTQYLLDEMLDDKRYLRINPYYKSAEAPAVLKNEKLAIDVTKQEQLDAIKSFAEYTFEKEKERILNFLEMN